MSFQQKYQITSRYLPKPSARRRGYPMSPGVRFIVAHDTGNPNSTAAQNVAYFASTPNPKIVTSAHLFVDDKEIIECIPALTSAPEKAWHVLYSLPTDNQMFGYNANDAAIGIEYCYGTNINADEAYRKFIWLIAFACDQFKLDPAKSVVGHFMLDPHRKSDPVSGLAHSRRTYEQLLRDVVAEYQECTGKTKPLTQQQWDESPQTGEVTATMRLNLRRGAPSTRADVNQVVSANAKLRYVSTIKNGESINGNPTWFKDGNGNYFWSGGVV
jgi:N-acetylmuramoyl-L-alanine amidase CwlA